MSETRGHQGAGAADCALRGPPPARARERQGEKGGGAGARGRGDGARGRERSGLGAGSQVSEQRDGRRGDAGESGNRAPESLQSHCPGLGDPGAEATWWQLAPFKENTEVLFWGRQNFIKRYLH